MEVPPAKRLIVYAALCLLLPLALLSLPRPRPQLSAPSQPAAPATAPGVSRPLPARRNPWTLDEARAALRRQPDLAYLQYVVLQLARQEKRLGEVLDDIPRFGAQPVGKPPELFGLLPDADAVRQGLQLEMMLAGQAAAPAGGGQAGARLAEVLARLRRSLRSPAPPFYSSAADKGATPQPPVPLDQLTGPEVPSQPRGELRAGKNPVISPLARAVPADFYFAEFRSLERLVAALDAMHPWAAFLAVQAGQDATRRDVRRRVQEQLAFEPGRDVQALVEQVALTGSDPFLAEGSDVTLLVQVKAEALDAFRDRTRRALASAAGAADAWQTTGKVLGVDYTVVGTPDRRVSVYAATLPAQRLHVRSNSPVALRRVLEAVLNRSGTGQAVARLGDTEEFRHVRALLPAGANEEDGLVYFPEAFLRRLVGPAVQIAEARRLIGATHLHMIAHAAQLYRTQLGKAPTSLDELTHSGYAPGAFNQGALASPVGGTYTLSADGTAGVCSVLGTTEFLKPCCELPVEAARADEAEGYREFVRAFEKGRRAWLAPVAMRLQTGPRHLRAEALVLAPPNSPAAAGLTRLLGGAPEPLDPLPVPKRSAAAISLRLNKERWLQEHLAGLPPRQLGAAARTGSALAAAVGSPFPADVPWAAALAGPSAESLLPARPLAAALGSLGIDQGRVRTFLRRGIGNQAALHFYDAALTFDLSLPTLTAELCDAAGSGELAELGLLYELGFFASTLSCPAYVAIPVADASAVDDFLAHLDDVLAREAPTWRDHLFGTHVQAEFYHLGGKASAVRALGLRVGPARYRVFWARIGGGLYVANQPVILDDLRAAAAAERGKAGASDRGPSAHAMLRLRPGQWSLALPGMRLGWEESNRAACQRNLAMLSAAARAFSFTQPVAGAAADHEARRRLVLKYAARMYGRDCTCPDGGHHELSADGKSFTCSVHGSLAAPRQPDRPEPSGVAATLMGSLSDATATLTATPDGFRVVVTITRR